MTDPSMITTTFTEYLLGTDTVLTFLHVNSFNSYDLICRHYYYPLLYKLGNQRRDKLNDKYTVRFLLGGEPGFKPR